MPNLKAIRKRISSVKSTKQVTAAMKMVAAAKLRKVQNKVIQLRPYVSKLDELVPDLISGYFGDFESHFFSENSTKKLLLIVISSNRGLCGAFNINVVKKTVEVIENYEKQGFDRKDIEIFAFGKKAAHILRFRGFNVIEEEDDIFDNLTYADVKPFAEKFINEFTGKKYAKIDLIYNSFKSAGSQLLKHEQYLPFEVKEDKKMPGGFIIEPDFEYLLHKLIPQSLTVKLFSALLDSFAAEQAARMTAMHKATDNAEEMIKKLTLEYNKARQAAITKEILEIVAGADALKNS